MTLGDTTRMEESEMDRGLWRRKTSWKT